MSYQVICVHLTIYQLLHITIIIMLLIWTQSRSWQAELLKDWHIDLFWWCGIPNWSFPCSIRCLTTVHSTLCPMPHLSPHIPLCILTYQSWKLSTLFKWLQIKIMVYILQNTIICSGRLRPTRIVQVGISGLRCAHGKWNGNNKCDNCVQFYSGNCTSTNTHVFDIPFTEQEVKTQLAPIIHFPPCIP